jgi:acetyl/propionyl-CoA carboxylase alpha subunit
MTITLTREEAQQMLDALDGHSVYKVEAAIKFLRARLEQPECVCGEPDTAGVHRQDGPSYQQPEREWQGLTDEEIKSLLWETRVDNLTFARVIEKVLREKNAS